MALIHHKRLFLPISIAILFLILVVNYLDRSAIAFAITPIKETFHLNNAQFGAIAGAFGIGYMVMTLLGGILVDRFKAHRVLTISALIWSLASFAMGLANGFWMLFLCRALLGIAEGPAFPAITQVTADWLPLAKRAQTLAISLAAVPLASVIGAPLLSHLIITFNWRVTYFILGGSGIILSILWLLVYRDNKQSYSKSPKKEGKTNWRFMLFNPALLVNNYSFFVFGYLLFFALIWLPGYLEQIYAVKLKEVGIFLIAPWLLATVLLLFGGFLSDKLLTKTHRLRLARSHVIWVCQLLSALFFLPVILYHSLSVAIIFISLGVGFGLMPNAVFYSLNIDLAKDRAATSLGIMDCFFSAAGILAPWVTGWLNHITGNFTAAIFLMMILTLSSVLAIVIFQHPDRYKKITAEFN